MVKELLKSLFKAGADDKPPTYDEAKKMAAAADQAVRRELAARPGVQPEILYFLAEDSSAEVRRAIAANKSAPVQADLVLARDGDDEVRGDLAEKIASLAPGLTTDEQDKLRATAYETLELLARDQATRVRQILAEALKDVADAPPQIIRQLAHDAEAVVSGPVLQFSPVLSEDDLLEVLESNPSTGNMMAVAQRAGVPATLADVIIATFDEEAVALLLHNQSAQIREEMLERVVDRAADIDAWHEPLVHRPILPERAAAKLARFVAHNLLDVLVKREDLAPDMLDEVREIVDKRLAEEPADGAADGAADGPPGDVTSAADAMRKATEMHEAGTLVEAAIADAIQAGDRELAMAGLAVLSGVKVGAVRTVVANRSAKGVAAVAWKAGLGAGLAESLQKRLALVPAKDLLRADGDAYPLDEASLEWQLDFVKDLG